MYILYTICYCTSLGFPRVYVVFTIPYTRLGLYIFFYLYMIIQNTQYTDYSLCFSVLPSLKLTDGISIEQKKTIKLRMEKRREIKQICLNDIPSPTRTGLSSLFWVPPRWELNEGRASWMVAFPS
jgi:hypothetical protein